MQPGEIIAANAILKDDSGNPVGTLLLGTRVNIIFYLDVHTAYVAANMDGVGLSGFLDMVYVSVDAPPTPVPPTGGAGRKFTNDPNEVATFKTAPPLKEVLNALGANWAELTATGARTLGAQYLVETGGSFCFNWNLGNVKSTTRYPHMYLTNVWECVPVTQAQDDTTRLNGLARYATQEEIREHKYSCANAVVIYNPPTDPCRFRAFKDLNDGATFWCKYYISLNQKHTNLIAILNAGDTTGFAEILKQVSYYTANSASYASGLAAQYVRIPTMLA